MMRLGIFAACLLLGAFVQISSAEAKLKFGEEDKIHFIQDVGVTGPDGEKLYLGYRTTTQWFLLGVYITNQGHVLGVKGDSKRYFRMPAGDELRRFQANGLLPDPLPSYSIPTLDLVFAYSLWILLGGWALWALFSWLRKRRVQPATPAA